MNPNKMNRFKHIEHTAQAYGTPVTTQLLIDLWTGEVTEITYSSRTDTTYNSPYTARQITPGKISQELYMEWLTNLNKKVEHDLT